MLRRRRLKFAVLSSMAAAVCCVGAGSASGETIAVVGGTASVIAAPGEANHTLVVEVTQGAPSALRVTDSGAPLVAGLGCQTDANSVLCLDGPLAFLGVLVHAGDGDDWVNEESRDRPVTLDGGSGSDTLRSGSAEGKSPTIYGGSGDDGLTVSNNGGGLPILHGGPGDDHVISRCATFWSCGSLYGESGDDHLSVSPMLGLARFDGGPGRDTYAYAPDFLLAGPPTATNLIVSGPGFDTLDASELAEQEVLIDLRVCGGCAERVIGSPWDDEINGVAGREAIEGGDGLDLIRGRGGQDDLAGQNGDDTIAARDDGVDTVSCGSGLDTVFADPADVVAPDCENVRLPQPN